MRHPQSQCPKCHAWHDEPWIIEACKRFDPDAPCAVCGLPVTSLSTDGPLHCPWCAAGAPRLREILAPRPPITSPEPRPSAPGLSLDDILRHWFGPQGAPHHPIRADILAWHEAELKKYGEAVREACAKQCEDGPYYGYTIDDTVRETPLPEVPR